MAFLLRPALVLFATLSVLTGLAYPALITGLAHVLFSEAAGGSLIRVGERTLGSALIGQPFADPGHFWSRPSATAPMAYNAASSSGSNQGPLNPALADAVRARIAALRAADPGNTAPVPADLVTASGSGLDPHISPAAALYQVSRVARARGMSEGALRSLIEARTESRQLGLLGEPRVNVLLLNLDLDGAQRGG
jgi:K+-transporting ATPase ATPase C chain